MTRLKFGLLLIFAVALAGPHAQQAPPPSSTIPQAPPGAQMPATPIPPPGVKPLPGTPAPGQQPAPVPTPPPVSNPVDAFLIQFMRAQDARIDALEKRVTALEAAQKAPVKK